MRQPVSEDEHTDAVTVWWNGLGHTRQVEYLKWIRGAVRRGDWSDAEMQRIAKGINDAD